MLYHTKQITSPTDRASRIGFHARFRFPRRVCMGLARTVVCRLSSEEYLSSVAAPLAAPGSL